MLTRILSSPAVSLAGPLPWRWSTLPVLLDSQTSLVSSLSLAIKTRIVSFSSSPLGSAESGDVIPKESSKRGPLEPGLYLVGTPIGNLEDITLRALRVLKSAHVILSEDTRHSGKLLHHYNIATPLLSYHKFNESQREQTVLRRLKEGEIVALISDAGTPGISDPGTELAKLCINENIPVIPIPGPSAFVAALSASVGFLPKHTSSRKERLMISANEATTQIFYVPPHKLLQFLEETSVLFSDSRRCVIAREITKLHEQFWRGTLGEAKEAFSVHKPKGEITLLIEGKANPTIETPSDCELEKELSNLISNGHSLSTAVKLVAGGTSMKKKTVYSIALRKFGKQLEFEEENVHLDSCKPE
ncbi:uncharacterized protein LOC133800988 isoform X3 [Humulus lupulus]|uniref:uncharacterized protein LOC133800988 isoform X3 n=1 Tax=Humulus lupulus TaxID=3486 RepID=UPI002B40BC98|nr:uncharacterized protein LOC133800988 isoform X3 [Humulus lupulus]